MPDEVVDVDLMKGKQREDAFRKVNPQMMLPALVDGDGPVLFQSRDHGISRRDPPAPAAASQGAARAGARARPRADRRLRFHPLLVPRVREYLEHELKLDEPTRLKWIHNWIGQALKALEANLAGSKETGRYCQGDAITIADICLVTQATGANFFKVDLSPFPTVRRIVDTCMHHARLRARTPVAAAGRAGVGLSNPCPRSVSDPMRLASFRVNGRTSYGAVTDGGIIDLGRKLSKYPTLLDLFRAQAVRRRARRRADYRVKDVEMLPPIPAPDKNICVGINYPDRSAEYKDGREAPKYPNLFCRFPTSLVGTEQPIVRRRCRTSSITRARSCW